MQREIQPEITTVASYHYVDFQYFKISAVNVLLLTVIKKACSFLRKQSKANHATAVKQCLSASVIHKRNVTQSYLAVITKAEVLLAREGCVNLFLSSSRVSAPKILDVALLKIRTKSTHSLVLTTTKPLFITKIIHIKNNCIQRYYDPCAVTSSTPWTISNGITSWIGLVISLLSGVVRITVR